MLLHEAGIGGKQGSNIYDEIKRVMSAEVSMKKLMVAAQCFGVGIGERKLSQVEASGISMTKMISDHEGLLPSVEGFSDKTIKVIGDGLPAWRKFYADASRYIIVSDVVRKKKSVKGKLTGERVSFTGYRDKDQEAWVEANGGEVVSFGSKTTILLYKDGGKESSKVDKAAAKGIKTMTFNQLEEINEK